jgi:hypothetical protein
MWTITRKNEEEDTSTKRKAKENAKDNEIDEPIPKKKKKRTNQPNQLC